MASAASTVTFDELSAFLVGADWNNPESVKEETDCFIFNQVVRVDRKFSFNIELKGGHGEKINYSVDQLVHFYRTRDLAVRDFVTQKTPFKKVSLAHRTVLLDTIKSAAAGGVDASTTITSSTSTTEQLSSSHVPDTLQQQPATTAAAHVPKKQKIISTTPLADALRKEVVYYDRNAALCATKSFQMVLDIDSRSKAMEAASKAKPTSATTSKRAKAVGSPIIIVPPNVSAVLNLFNIRHFLEDHTYVSYEDLVKQSADGTLTKPDSVYVMRRKHPLTGDDLRFKVIDSVLNLDDDAWDRVVAVIVSGQAWQLKGWKWHTAQEIFAHVKGLYVYFDDAKLPAQVQSWNVTTLPIKHHARNKDIIQVHELWCQIDNHLARHKPKLVQALVEEAEVRMRSEREARKKGMLALQELEEEEDEGNNTVEMAE